MPKQTNTVAAPIVRLPPFPFGHGGTPAGP